MTNQKLITICIATYNRSKTVACLVQELLDFELNDQIEKREERVLDAGTEVENKLDHLNEASKDKKAVENLRERKFSEHRVLEKRVERKQTDEIANRVNLTRGDN